MPNQIIPPGNALKSWSVPEFTAHRRGRAWYIITGAVIAALLIWALLTTNYLFAIIVVLFAVIMALSGLREPELVEVRITDTGIAVDENFYPYRDIEKFHIVYQPPTVKCLYLSTNGNLRPRLCIQLADENPVEIRDLLSRHIPEDLEQTDEPIIEYLGRILKI